MKRLLCAAAAASLLVAAGTAAADLYRWKDPASGSTKFSSYPPPWYGDPARERGAPKVEVIPSAARAPEPAAPAVPAAPAAAVAPVALKPPPPPNFVPLPPDASKQPATPPGPR